MSPAGGKGPVLRAEEEEEGRQERSGEAGAAGGRAACGPAGAGEPCACPGVLSSAPASWYLVCSSLVINGRRYL